MFRFQVSIQNHGARFDQVLASHDQVQSRSEAKKIILSHAASINRENQTVAPDTLLKAGDIITFTAYQPSIPDLKPIAYPLEIHFEDDDLLVIYKAQGVVCHPSAGHWEESLVNYLKAYTDLSEDELRPGIVHRLDKDTSGLLLIAKNNLAHTQLTTQFANREVEKKYLALCYGVPKTQFGTVNLKIGRHPVDRKKQAISEKGKEAITEWQLIKKFQYFSLIECNIKTGRTHQIRVHLHQLGLPIVGDPVYLNKNKNLPDHIAPLLSALNGQLLHAHYLKLLHPIKKCTLKFQRHVPRYFSTLINQLQTIK